MEPLISLTPEEVAVIEEVVADKSSQEESEQVDWDYVETIEDTKEGKLELDKYAEKFGVGWFSGSCTTVKFQIINVHYDLFATIGVVITITIFKIL